MTFKRTINIILPIALAIILPGLGLVTNGPNLPQLNFGFFQSWMLASLVLYGWWHILWNFWEIKLEPKFLWFSLLTIGFISLVLSIFYLYTQFTYAEFKWQSVFRITMPTILFLAIQSALKSQENITQLMLEKEQIQTENYKAQLKTLQAKIDPHFLFNSLNTLRSMVRQNHNNSETFIMSLSQFYRQTLKHNEDTSLKLSDELEVLKSYLFLMKSRTEDAVKVNMDIDESLHQFHLPTLGLQIIVENCFKHNSMTSKRPLNIEVISTEDHYIKVTNNIQPKIGDSDSSGYGLDLLRKRYDLMNIPNGVLVEKTPEQFSVKLKLI